MSKCYYFNRIWCQKNPQSIVLTVSTFSKRFSYVVMLLTVYLLMLSSLRSLRLQLVEFFPIAPLAINFSSVVPVLTNFLTNQRLIFQLSRLSFRPPRLIFRPLRLIFRPLRLIFWPPWLTFWPPRQFNWPPWLLFGPPRLTFWPPRPNFLRTNRSQLTSLWSSRSLLTFILSRWSRIHNLGLPILEKPNCWGCGLKIPVFDRGRPDIPKIGGDRLIIKPEAWPGKCWH